MRLLYSICLFAGLSFGQGGILAPILNGLSVSSSGGPSYITTTYNGTNSGVAGTTIATSSGGTAGAMTLATGDLVYCVVTWDSGAVTVTGVTDGVSNALTADAQGEQVGNWSGNPVQAFYTLSAVSSAASIFTASFTGSAGSSGNDVSISCEQFRGLTGHRDTPPTPYNPSSGTVTTATIASFTTTHANEVAIGTVGCAGFGTFTPFTMGAFGSVNPATLGTSNVVAGQGYAKFSSIQSTQTATINWSGSCGAVMLLGLFY